MWGKYTKYFLNLEHRHFNKKQKTIKSLHVQLSDNSVVKKDNKILKKISRCHTNERSLC